MSIESPLPRDTLAAALAAMRGDIPTSVAAALRPTSEEYCASHSITSAMARITFERKYGDGPGIGLRMVAATYDVERGEWAITINHVMSAGESHHSRNGGASTPHASVREGAPVTRTRDAVTVTTSPVAPSPTSAPAAPFGWDEILIDDGTRCTRVALLREGEGGWSIDGPGWADATFASHEGARGAYVAALARLTVSPAIDACGTVALTLAVDGAPFLVVTGRPGAFQANGAGVDHMRYKTPALAFAHVVSRITHSTAKAESND